MIGTLCLVIAWLLSGLNILVSVDFNVFAPHWLTYSTHHTMLQEWLVVMQISIFVVSSVMIVLILADRIKRLLTGH